MSTSPCCMKCRDVSLEEHGEGMVFSHRDPVKTVINGEKVVSTARLYNL